MKKILNERLISLLQTWSTSKRWLNLRSYDQTDAKLRSRIENVSLEIDAIESGMEEITPRAGEAFSSLKSELLQALKSELLAHQQFASILAVTKRHAVEEFNELRTLIAKIAPSLNGELPILGPQQVDEPQATANGGQVAIVLGLLLSGRTKLPPFMNATELANLFDLTIGAMRMRLNRIRKRNLDCSIDPPAPGDQRTKTDGYLYRTEMILSELRKKPGRAKRTPTIASKSSNLGGERSAGD
jgi:hypothetical protein